MGCFEYAKFWCADGRVRRGQEWAFAAKYGQPEQHCCVCGKGRPVNPGTISVLVHRSGRTTPELSLPAPPDLSTLQKKIEEHFASPQRVLDATGRELSAWPPEGTAREVRLYALREEELWVWPPAPARLLGMEHATMVAAQGAHDVRVAMHASAHSHNRGAWLSTCVMYVDLYVYVCVFDIHTPNHTGRAFTMWWLSSEEHSRGGPRVFVVENFLNVTECDVIIKASKGKLHRSMIEQSGDGPRAPVNPAVKNNEMRTSSTAWLKIGDHPELLMDLRMRAASLMRLPVENAEPLQVVRYEEQERYMSHTFFLHRRRQPQSKLWNDDSKNRFATVLIYLSDVSGGGETAFPFADDNRKLQARGDCKRGKRVRPKKGRAVVFYNMLPNTHNHLVPDQTSMASGCPVASGVKWAANFWLWNKAIISYFCRGRREFAVE